MNRISDNLNLSMNDKMKLNDLKMRQKTLELLLSSDKKKTAAKNDIFTAQNSNETVFSNYCSDGNLQIETPPSKEEVWEFLKNFTGGLCDECFYVNGKKCSTSMVQKIDESVMQEIKAVNNEVIIQADVFYGVTADDGTKWAMNATPNAGFAISGSEHFYGSENGISLAKTDKWSIFFRSLAATAPGAGIYMSLTKEDVSSMMETIGFEPGFCTLNVDGTKYSFYYSNNGNVYPKYHYDGIYEGLTQFDNTDNNYVGDQWNYNGNTYKLDENGHLNVPYGEDLFNCLERPKGKLWEQMQERQLAQNGL